MTLHLTRCRQKSINPSDPKVNNPHNLNSVLDGCGVQPHGCEVQTWDIGAYSLRVRRRATSHRKARSWDAKWRCSKSKADPSGDERTLHDDEAPLILPIGAAL